MPFLQTKGASNMGVFISVVSLCCAVIFSNQNEADWVYLIPVVFIFLSSISFSLVARQLTKTYWRD
jgi:ABC-type dipeptide/oligopeptide/nickel transport system permease subunit